MQKNKIIIAVAAVVVILIVGTIAVFATRSKSPNMASNSSNATQVKTMQPSDVGLQLSIAPNDKQTVVMDITKLNGIKSVEYDMTYDAEEKDPDSGQVLSVTQGVSTNGTPVKVHPGDSKLERKIYLGTCSATCRPSKVESDVKFVIKINFSNGEIGQIEDTLPYPHASVTPADE